MSFAETSSAAIASIVVSPWTTEMSFMGPQLVGVIAPENVPVPVAVAAPTKKVSSSTTSTPPLTSPGRSFTCVPPGVAELRADIPPDRRIESRNYASKLTDESVNSRLGQRPQIVLQLVEAAFLAVSPGHVVTAGLVAEREAHRQRRHSVAFVQIRG